MVQVFTKAGFVFSFQFEEGQYSISDFSSGFGSSFIMNLINLGFFLPCVEIDPLYLELK